MRNPKYVSKLFSQIFLILAVLFLLMGILLFFGVMSPSKSSMVQDASIMATVFSIIGGLFAVAAFILSWISVLKNKLHNTLHSEGINIKGYVESVKRIKSISYGRQSPYRIYYAYSFDGNTFNKKSYLLWDKPRQNKGDEIDVYVDKMGHSTICI